MDTDISPLPQPTQLPYAPARWHPIAWWMLASLCSLGLGLLTTSVIVFVGLQHLNLGIFLLALLMGGTVVGAVQLPFLNALRSIVPGQQWLLVSIIGCSLAVGAAFVIAEVTQHLPIRSTTALTTLAVYLVGPASGFILGASQWMILRRTIQHAALWILTIVVSSSTIWVVLLLLASFALGGNGD